MGKLRTIRAIAILSALGCAISGVSQDRLALDLSEPDIRARLEALAGVCSGGRLAAADHVPLTKPELTLTLEVKSLNAARFKVGDYISSEIRLTNRGPKPVLIPWSPYDKTVYGPNCKWPKVPGATGLRGSIRLELADATGQRDFEASTFLYGISSDPDSYRDLAPHESATIKIGGPIYLAPRTANETAEKPETALPGEFIVTASFDLDNSSLSNPYWVVRSRNELRVKIDDK